MDEFSRLVSEQMKTMDRLIFLQSELERCQEVELELKVIQQETELESVQLEIAKMKEDLREIQQMFENQTEEVIRSYQSLYVSV